MAERRRERKVVTVLFADLVGFTSRAEGLDPEDVAAELERYHDHVRAELERRGGTVEKFIGDAVMALFGAPTTHEDDAERAVRAAFAIRDWAVDEAIEVRIGINTGEALVHVDALPGAGESMAAGDVINTGARLQSAAAVNSIVVGEQTRRATEQAIDYGQLEPVEAKGKAQPVPAWEAVQARSRIAVERVHGAALVGRQREVALLEDALARVVAERSPQLVTIVGVPGIGKSRLVLELYEAIERMPELISWRHGRCLSYGEGITFWALGEMVKAQLGILEGDDATVAEQKLASAAADPWVESHLRPLLGLAGGATGKGDMRDEAFAAWRRYLEELAEERPLVLVFEDLHWADDHLLDFVDHLVEWSTGVPLLVVCTARPEFLSRRPAWGGGKPNALTISLTALSDDEIARLLADLLGAVLPADTQSELLARAGGNPLYAEEFARMLRDRGRVGELPETVQGLIAARLDLLEPDQKALLQDAAVIGTRFWAGALGSLDAGRSLDAGLHQLERKEFVRRERGSTVEGDDEYAFRHLLVRDVAYGQIPRADRIQKHLLAAAWIERLGRREDHAEMLAHHYLQAIELTVAAGGSSESFAAAARAALSDAGDRAFALNAYDTASRFFRAALDLLPGDDGGRGRLLYALGRSLYQLGTPDPGMLEQAAAALLQAGDVEGAAEAETTLCEHFWLAGETGQAIEHLDRARDLLAERDPSPAKARMTATAARLMMLSARDDDAIRLGEEARALAEQVGRDEIKASALVDIGSARSALGEDEGLAILAEAVEFARGVNAAFDLCRGIGNLATWRWLRGELDVALPLWQDALAEAKRYGQTGFARWFRGVPLHAEYEFGMWDEAMSRADTFIGEVEAGSPHYLAGACHFYRASMRLSRGDEAGAAADAEQALVLAERIKDPQTLYPAVAVCAHVAHELGTPPPSVEPFLEALKAGGGVGFGLAAVHVLAWSLVPLGRGPELAEALEQFDENPWARAGRAYALGDPAGAADLLGAMGAVASEAYCRLSAARRLVEEGRRAGADGQLHRALSFHRSVGASRYVREGESLLAASA
ncbi:MAG TPA: AAA family ATPase [Gaiellaceae bacterium]|nr:AAA family ATPase [Gaiellaceae bacterium]